MMLDWNEYQKQIGAQLTDFMKLTPDSVRGYQALSNANAEEYAPWRKSEAADFAGGGGDHPVRRLYHGA